MKKMLNFLAIATVTLVSYAASAQNWQKVVVCNDGDMLIDKATVSAPHNSGTYDIYQVVIHDRGVVEYFASQGFKYLTNSFSGNPILVAGWLSKRGENVYSSSSDLDYNYDVKPEGDGLRVSLRSAHLKANWYFEHCESVSN